MLISPAQLRANLDNPQWVVFDCRHDLMDHSRGGQLYRQGHIPGANFAPVETALTGKKTGNNGRHPLPLARDFAGFLMEHGVAGSTQIVAYDDVGGQYAARLWWMARWLGLTQVAVLDGGLGKWMADGLPLTAAEPPVRGSGYFGVQFGATRSCTAAEVSSGLAAGTCLVLDARAPERFRGEVEPIDRVAGHIPSAVNRPYKSNLNSDLTMRPPGELRQEFAHLLGPRRPDQVIHQCGSGITACVNLLAMEYAGLAGSALYVGSWSEWIADPARPIAKA
ncbi:MAG: sulfurtransferase [Cephaloticoccus sp.]|nr:sulfurtransferase [Cephaloticoccus sp.]MCF7761183.1 sulfurtransferase [Cephaloticoccus sp.]